MWNYCGFKFEWKGVALLNETAIAQNKGRPKYTHITLKSGLKCKVKPKMHLFRNIIVSDGLDFHTDDAKVKVAVTNNTRCAPGS